MLNSIIDRKTEKVKFGYWPLRESIKTTMELVSLGDDYYDLYYLIQYDIIKKGKIANIHIPCNSYITTKGTDHSELILEIVTCSCTDGYVAIHIKMSTEIKILGTQVIYNQVLDNFTEKQKVKTEKLKTLSEWNPINKLKKWTSYVVAN